jgi:hypothetical protein
MTLALSCVIARTSWDWTVRTDLLETPFILHRHQENARVSRFLVAEGESES